MKDLVHISDNYRMEAWRRNNKIFGFDFERIVPQLSVFPAIHGIVNAGKDVTAAFLGI